MSLPTWNLPHPYIICNLRSPRSEVKIARLSGRSVLCTVEGQNGEGRTWGEPESWATECPSCGFGRDTFSPVSCDDTENTSEEVVSGFPWEKREEQQHEGRPCAGGAKSSTTSSKTQRY
ncbi:mCG1043452 [Mus musculus]|nr:mCG1043452 [Mus musculus]